MACWGEVSLDARNPAVGRPNIKDARGWPSGAAAARTLWGVSAVAVGRSCAALGGMRACRLPPRLFWKKQTCRPPLQISGHGVVYAVVALALHDFFPAPLWRWGPRTLGWLALIKLCIQVRAASSHNIHITQFC